MEMTNTDDSSTAQKSRAGTYVAYGLVALVLYFLSIGPAWWLRSNSYLSVEVFVTVYTPIFYLQDNTFLDEPLRLYVNLWFDLLD